LRWPIFANIERLIASLAQTNVVLDPLLPTKKQGVGGHRTEKGKSGWFTVHPRAEPWEEEEISCASDVKPEEA